MGRRVLIASAALAIAVPTAAIAAPTAAADRFDKAPSTGRVSSPIRPQVMDGAAKVNVMVEMTGDPVAVVEATSGKLTKAERGAIKKQLRQAQDAIAGDISAKGGKVLSHLQSAYNGMRVRISPSKVSALATLPGVAAVHAITHQNLDNTTSVPYLGVPQVWQDTTFTGKNVKLAIIDTGIDYTHATFGGPGTAAAYDAAHADETQAADPSLFGPAAPRVKGGFDFVGDDYDADGVAGSATPQPDPNPLDCNGHGTHVAGTAGGGGVAADGSAYTGPYDASTAGASFKVGPGVAPEVDLYALRVFGCEGSTDVTTEAIDWAVDQGMDVINMSLGSPFGRADDPTAIAASNAVGAGVVVVTSAGNSGPNPYLTGAPGAGDGVIAVAAVDSTESFPGAKLSFDGKTATAINANDADLPSGDFEVVAVTDDPATTEVDESLGCSVGDFTQAGVSSEAGAPKQVAVVSRGSCARVGKAIFGQQAGADAVIMVNTAEGYPPYEGEILANPDDGTAYHVTIPFLGVQPSGGAALLAAEGTSLQMSAVSLQNPGYTGFASFSSGGPRNGDSGLSPNVAAPGVSIFSAAVGSGSGGEYLSGTSMAAPHVAGVAALGVQAHPTWDAQDVAAALVSTADPSRIGGYAVTLGGAGLVDAAQLVTTQAFAAGDAYRTTSGNAREASLSFGFAETSGSFVGTRQVVLTNRGSSPVTYTLGVQASPQSRPARVSLGARTVRVPAGGRVTVPVTLTVPAATVGSSIGNGDQFGFHEVSGAVTATSSAGVLRVPYLLVPRAQAQVTASLIGGADPRLAANAPGRPGLSLPDTLTVRLANQGGALDADADFYTWGLSDARDVRRGAGGSGYDLRAAGVQSFVTSDTDQLLVFAVNTYGRWSNAATDEFDVSVDTTGDGAPDYVVFSYDSGALRADEYDGLTEVFVYDVAGDALFAAGYLAQAPTDSSTILLPVDASSLGLTEAKGSFGYSVASYSIEGPWGDEMPGTAAYNPWAKAIADGDYVTVERRGTQTVTVAVDQLAAKAQKPKGLMVVVYDNRSGEPEALLLGR